MNYQSYFKFAELFKFGDDADGEEFGLENEQQKQSTLTGEDNLKLEAIDTPDPGKYNQFKLLNLHIFQYFCCSGGAFGSWQRRNLQNEALLT